MKKKQEQVLVIGLGRFGQSLALVLAQHGAEVMAIDASEEATEQVANDITHVMIADSTEETVLREVGLEHFDVVVCAIGGDIQASIMTTLLLKELGVKKLVAKASTSLHGRALEKLGVDRVVYPERDMAERLSQEILTPKFTAIMNLTVRESMFEMPAPRRFEGKTLMELSLRDKFHLNVLAIRRGSETIVSPKADEVLHEGDSLLVLGNRAEAQLAIDE